MNLRDRFLGILRETDIPAPQRVHIADQLVVAVRIHETDVAVLERAVEEQREKVIDTILENPYDHAGAELAKSHLEELQRQLEEAQA